MNFYLKLFLYSVEDILRDRSSDPETILTNLGFASSFDCETQKARRIPVRFFVEPSKARGISVDNFIKTNPEVRRTLTERQSSFVLTSPQTSVTSSPFIANLLLPRTQSLGQLFTTETAPTPEVVEPEEKGQCDSDSVVSSLSGSRDCDVSGRDFPVNKHTPRKDGNAKKQSKKNKVKTKVRLF